jgi:hypothetical protein
MKKVLSFIFLSAWMLNAMACDICGCGVGSYYLGIMPEFNKRFIGLRYQYKSLETHLGPDGERTVLTNDETYQSVELWGAWNFGKKWRVMAIVPYNINLRKIKAADETGKKFGLGDIVLMGHYKILEIKKTNDKNKMIVHTLWGGAGIKLPSGKYKDEDEVANSPNNFQLGSGSTDFMFNLVYDFRKMDFGINSNVSYKVNTENKNDYRYANKFTTNVLAYYKFALKNDKYKISPNIGGMFDIQSKDVLYGKYDVATSGGYSLAAVAGAEVNLKKISFGGNYQLPVSQNLADHRVKSKSRFLVHVSYAF